MINSGFYQIVPLVFFNLVNLSVGAICTYSYTQGYYTITGRLKYRKRYTDIHCSDKCCGEYPSEYCCTSNGGSQEISISEIAGIVIGCLTGCLVLMCFCICCWLATAKSRRNRHHHRTTVSHISGHSDLRRSTQGDIILPPSYEETVNGFDNSGFVPELYSLPPSYDDVFHDQQSYKGETEAGYSHSGSIHRDSIEPVSSSTLLNRDSQRRQNLQDVRHLDENHPPDSILVQYNRDNDNDGTSSQSESNTQTSVMGDTNTETVTQTENANN